MNAPTGKVSDKASQTESDQEPVDKSVGPGGQKSRPAGEPERPDPTRYGDWEKNGRCIDF